MKIKLHIICAAVIASCATSVITYANNTEPAAKDDSMQANVTQTVSDSYITTKIKSLLVKSALVDEKNSLPATAIHVETNDGVVTLTGTVENTAQKDEALKIANSVKDVKEVKSLLTIKGEDLKDNTTLIKQ